MGRKKSAPIGSRYRRVCEELLEMGTRVAVRSYGTAPRRGAWAGSTLAAAAARRQRQAAAKVEIHGSEFILYGGGKN
ncbi:hypothetical protein PAHAL_9G049200 [Panicum hallii]|uniref:Uncharacterized protein n=1 Tax=Panicum hallii TaxID=206008 RepID=A0A2S3IH51_9POAL|nr:hypothetical protein PAHAL_9G049200 [Panicum hallii]